MKGKERVGGAAGREGALRGVELRGCGRSEGRGLQLVEEEPFCLGGKVHRRTAWVEQALYREGLLRRAQKAWAYGTSHHLPSHLRKPARF